MLLTMTSYLIYLIEPLSNRASPFKLILDVKADLVECHLKTFISILANSENLLIQSETVLLAISL